MEWTDALAGTRPTPNTKNCRPRETGLPSTPEYNTNQRLHASKKIWESHVRIMFAGINLRDYYAHLQRDSVTSVSSLASAPLTEPVKTTLTRWKIQSFHPPLLRPLTQPRFRLPQTRRGRRSKILHTWLKR
jgi:hypothetical protein